VATNSSDLIMFKQGQFETFGTAQGITGTINSIGVNGIFSSYYNDGTPFLAQNHLIVATTEGTLYFDFVLKRITANTKFSFARTFDITYRNSIFDSPNVRFPSDTVTTIGIITLGYGTVYESNFYLNSKTFGNTLKSAFTTYPNVHNFAYGSSFPTASDILWATEKGLFQTKWLLQRYESYGFHRYLSDQNITKITSIIGMANFGNEQATYSSFSKENILVGTANGLYFSNSKYHHYDDSSYDFYYCDELGSKSVNDICTNADSYDHQLKNDYVRFEYNNVCENGVWVATADGLYFVKPDYMRFIKPSDRINAAWFEQETGIAELETCESSEVKIKLYDVQSANLSVQWYKNGQPLTGESANELKVNAAGEYNAVLYDPCSDVRIETNHLKLTLITAPNFVFNYPDKINLCAGETTTLKTAQNNSKYQYRWYKNGALNGNETFALDVTQSGKYKLEISSCSGAWVSTKEVEVNFISVPQPTLSANKTAYCIGDIGTLSTVFMNDGSYTLNWFRDGSLLSTEQNKTSIATAQAGNYTLKVNSNLVACDNTSSALAVIFISVPKPIISANKSIYCVGESAVLTTNFINDGTYTVNWLFNGAVLSAEKDKISITATQPGNYAIKLSSKLAPCDNTSAVYALNFESIPTLKLEKVITTTLCDGQNIDIKATYSGGTIKWSTQEIGDKITVSSSGKYSATITSAAGCTVTEDIDVLFVANPTLQLADATVCELRNQSVTLKAPPGFAKYEWNGQSGSANFTTRVSGPIILKITDNNGCTATQTINVTNECHDIYVPNTFTPNNDGYNDTWIIEGLEGDESVIVKVFNRSGEMVYRSTAHQSPWDGVYKGKKLPSATYYYIINAQKGAQTLNGSVTIIN
jgi:gliding motility-associated-like protein